MSVSPGSQEAASSGFLRDLDDAWTFEQDNGGCSCRPCLLIAGQPFIGDVVLGRCGHGVDLDRDFCPHGCRA